MRSAHRCAHLRHAQRRALDGRCSRQGQLPLLAAQSGLDSRRRLLRSLATALAVAAPGASKSACWWAACSKASAWQQCCAHPAERPSRTVAGSGGSAAAPAAALGSTSTAAVLTGTAAACLAAASSSTAGGAAGVSAPASPCMRACAQEVAWQLCVSCVANCAAVVPRWCCAWRACSTRRPARLATLQRARAPAMLAQSPLGRRARCQALLRNQPCSAHLASKQLIKLGVDLVHGLRHVRLLDRD